MKTYNNPQLAHYVALLDMKKENMRILSQSNVINELPVKGYIYTNKPKIGFKL